MVDKYTNIISFNPANLRSGFEELLGKNEYKERIKADLNRFMKNKEELEKDPDYIGAIEKIGELIASNNYFRPWPVGLFIENFDKRVRPLGSNFFRTQQGQDTLIEIIESVAIKRETAVRKIKEILTELKSKSVKDWNKTLYAQSQKGEETNLGPKGRDIYLRDMGYLDRVPIDTHEMRFILRTGIYHLCSQREFDPLKKAITYLNTRGTISLLVGSRKGMSR